LVRRLRVKIETSPDEPQLIQNLPGVGYGFGL
jgi:DNA-binding response OmpR family regulator